MPSDAVSRLSRRGARLATQPPLAEYIREHFARAGSRWHPENAPDGYIALCIAENALMADLLLPRLASEPAPPPRVLGYDDMIGSHELRERLAGFLERTFLGRRVAPEQIAVLAGAGTVLETLFYAIADPGDAVLVPTPSYAGFWADLETRDALHVVPVPCHSADRFRLTIESLDAALARAERPVRALLFTNPDNPLGRVASADEVRAIADWAEARELHLVCDEIYALSVFGGTPFTSVASVRPALGERVHVVWAFSKDFGASGLRCGLVVSENAPLLAAIDGLAYWGAVSGHTQWLLGRMIDDPAWVDAYRGELQQRLGEAYGRVATALGAARIPHLAAEAGIFLVCDLRGFLKEPSREAESALWRRLLEEANVNVTPGSACRIEEPGFVRLCYASEPIDAVLTGIERLGRLLHSGTA